MTGHRVRDRAAKRSASAARRRTTDRDIARTNIDERGRRSSRDTYATSPGPEAPAPDRANERRVNRGGDD